MEAVFREVSPWLWPTAGVVVVLCAIYIYRSSRNLERLLVEYKQAMQVTIEMYQRAPPEVQRRIDRMFAEKQRNERGK